MKINKLTLLFAAIFVTFISINTAVAQSASIAKTDTLKTQRPESVYLEIGSAGLFFSFNYDTRFSNQRNGLGGRLGIGFWNSSNTFITVPFQLNYLLGAKSNFLELGAGATLMWVNGSYYGNPLIGSHFVNVSTTVLPTTTIGYRHQPLHHGLNFGVSFNPMLLKGVFIPYFGGSLGYTFK